MKTPLRVEKLLDDDDEDEEYVLFDAAENCVASGDKETLESLVSLANAHAAQPGAPREDGWYTAKLMDLFGDRVIERRGGKCFLGHVEIQEQFVMRHRKHEPLEVPKCL